MNHFDLARAAKSATAPVSSDRGGETSPPTAPNAEGASRTAAPTAVGIGVGGPYGPTSRRWRVTESTSYPSGGRPLGSFLTGKLRNPASLEKKDTVATRRSSPINRNAGPRKFSGRVIASPRASTGSR